MRKTAADKRYEAAREEWMKQLEAAGKKIVSGEEADTLYEVETLLSLAVRRLSRAHFVSARALQQRLFVLYEEMHTTRARTVAYNSFRMDEGESSSLLPDLVLLPEIRPIEETER